MKKYTAAILVILAGILLFFAALRLTDSWKLSLGILTALVIYALWIVRFELGITGSNKEDAAQQLNERRRKHMEDSKDNPTIR
jgi:membrane protein implicated in regulation of membrane protease activity